MQSGQEVEGQLRRAREIHDLSVRRWGTERATVIIGQHPKLDAALHRVLRFAAADGPILITGETGVGKELFARALVVRSNRARTAFHSVNCAQYGGENLTASELFGYRKGAFTGASSNHQGIFGAADGGTVFLDEVGELSLVAQAMLLRVISEREIVPVGDTRPRHVDVRVIAATNRDLASMVREGRFREDLYFRLRCLVIDVPSLRDRGDDWRLIADYHLRELDRRHARTRSLASDALRVLGVHPWPGNVRELQNVLETGYHLSDETQITVEDLGLGLGLENMSRRAELARATGIDPIAARCERMASSETTFWTDVHKPYIDRELNREQVRAIVARGLGSYGDGSYKRMLEHFGVSADQYLKAMDFLRHHELKPLNPVS